MTAAVEQSPPLRWLCRDRTLVIGDVPLVMGVLNVTPDSFSDGGRYAAADAAVEHGLRMAADGAAIVDVGGESTRPGAPPVPAEEEARRVIPVIGELRRQSDVCLPVDTSKAGVAAAALDAGADVINDVSALKADPEMEEVARRSGAGVVLMHMQGTPRTMQDAPHYGNVVAEVAAYLNARVRQMEAAGIDRARLSVDPGIGFGKTLEHNLLLLAGLRRLGRFGVPVVVGLSRKRFLGMLTGRVVEDRLAASLAALVYCVLNGAHVLRVHDVRESADAVRIAAALMNAAREESRVE